MRQAVAAKGVDVSHLHTEPGSTALSHVTVVNGDRVFGDYEEGVMENFRLTEEDVDFLCGHDLVVSGLWGRVEGDLPRLKTRGVRRKRPCPGWTTPFSPTTRTETGSWRTSSAPSTPRGRSS